MKRNSKLAIFIALMIAVVLVWIPKGKKPTAVSANTSSVTIDQAIPVAKAVPRKRTEFVEWGRNPFVWSQGEETADASHLELLAIMWGNKGSQAVINDSIVHVGDKIADKTVKQIEQNRVILTDGTKDYILELQE